VSSGSVRRVLKPFGGVFSRRDWEPPEGRLGLDDRVNIKLWIGAGESFAEIGRRLGRATSTISREVGGCGGRAGYAPMTAHGRARDAALRPKQTRLEANPALCARVVADLEALWSPEEISGRLRRLFPDDPEMWVSHETIYKSLFVQGRGELRRERACQVVCVSGSGQGLRCGVMRSG
jgi:IS30 family transposase